MICMIGKILVSKRSFKNIFVVQNEVKIQHISAELNNSESYPEIPRKRQSFLLENYFEF